MYETKIGVVIGHKEIYGTQPHSLKVVLDLLKEYDQQVVNVTLSTIMLMVTHKDTKEGGFMKHLSILNSFIPPEAIERAESYVASHLNDSPHALLHDQIILSLLKLNAEHNNPGGRSLEFKEDRYLFGEIILSMNSIWLDVKTIMPHGRKGGTKGLKETLRVLQTVQLLTSGSNDPVINLLVRGNYFIDEIVKDNRLDFAATFEDATGINIRNYIDLVFAISLGWTVVEFSKIPTNIYKDASKYFRNTRIPQNQIDKFIELVSFDMQDFKKLNQTYLERVGLKKDNLYSHITFLLKPLSKDGDRLLCANPYFVSNLLTEGAYNTVREAIKGTNKEQILPIAWGEVFERYIHLVMEETFKDLYHKVIHSPRGEESIDGIIELDNSVLLLEIKYPHWTYEARVTGKRDAVRSFILKFARYKPYKNKPGDKIRKKKKGFGQIKQFVEEYNKGEYAGVYNFGNKKLVPVVILGETFPFDPINMELMMNHIEDQECMIRQDNVGYPILLNAEEAELIQSLVEAEGVNMFERTIRRYSDEIDKSYKYKLPYFRRPTTFKNTIYREGLAFPGNSHIKKRFNEIVIRIQKLLRPD